MLKRTYDSENEIPCENDFSWQFTGFLVIKDTKSDFRTQMSAEENWDYGHEMLWVYDPLKGYFQGGPGPRKIWDNSN